MKKTALKAVATQQYEPALVDQVVQARAVLSALEELIIYLLSDDYPNDRPFEETPFGVDLLFSDLNDRLTKILDGLNEQDNAKERKEA